MPRRPFPQYGYQQQGGGQMSQQQYGYQQQFKNQPQNTYINPQMYGQWGYNQRSQIPPNQMNQMGQMGQMGQMSQMNQQDYMRYIQSLQQQQQQQMPQQTSPNNNA